MIGKDTLRLIEDKVKQAIEPLGFDLVEIKNFMTAREMVIRLLVDRQEGGITLEECTQINNQVGQLLEEQSIISERYALEVFSPGIDRDLIQPKDFKRVLNKIIYVYLKEEHDGKREFESKLINLDTQGIYILVNENKQVFIPFTKINKAKQVIRL